MRASSAASAARIWRPWSACSCTVNCDIHRTRPVGGCKGAELMAAGTLHPRQYMVQSSSASVSCCRASIFTRHRSMSKFLARAVKARGWTSCVRRRRRSSVFMTDSASCNSVRKSLDVRGDHAIGVGSDGRAQALHRRCQCARRALRLDGESSCGNRPCLLEPCCGPGRSRPEGRQRNRRCVGAGHARMPSNAIS